MFVQIVGKELGRGDSCMTILSGLGLSLILGLALGIVGMLLNKLIKRLIGEEK